MADLIVKVRRRFPVVREGLVDHTPASYNDAATIPTFAAFETFDLADAKPPCRIDDNLTEMCGRISFSFSREDLLETYAWLRDAPELEPRYNVAPTDPVVAIGPGGAEVVRWGIDGRKGGLFNLRSETAIERPYYKARLLGSRVVIPANHFYEWRGAGRQRTPVAIARTDGKLLNLAGLRGRWEQRPAATILTTVPNAEIGQLHNRMPVVLSDDDAATWVLEELSLKQVGEFLKPCPDGWLRLTPASTLVNNVRNQGPELLDASVRPPEAQLELLAKDS